MNEELFGPLAPITPFKDFDGVMKEANRLAWASRHAYTKNTKTMAQVGSALESGMVSINHHGLALPEVPFGGAQGSGWLDGGRLEAYLNIDFVCQLGM
jgi:succinate-semialdehyde dehydrogenase/glutarate-semialdehyde dehydrogenase